VAYTSESSRVATSPRPVTKVRSRRWRLVVLLAVLIITANLSQPESASSVLRFGVLGSTCDAQRASALWTAGVRLAEVRVRWDKFEPAPGIYDPAYLSELGDTIHRCRHAGLTVVLSPGFHYAPQWVSQLPAGAYRNQYGGTGPTHVPNIIFSAAARRAAANYIAKLDTVIPLDTFGAIRVGTSDSGELGYPGRAYGSDVSSNNFWAFDTAAQTGKGLAAGATLSPLPGWTPGSTTWHDQPVSTQQVKDWFSWYARSAAHAVMWEIELFRHYDYRGDFHLPLAGRGALPADLNSALAAHLDGTGDRDGSLERGLFYPEQLADIAAISSTSHKSNSSVVVADVTGLDDATAVQARQHDPPQDTCTLTDAGSDLLTNTQVAQWSTFRWAIANARHAGLDVMGENPGSPQAPGTGGDPSSDNLTQQMVHATRYAKQCGLTTMMWAFEDDLFGDPITVSVSSYSQQIHQVKGGSP
jgi:hypothetical protein